MKYLCIHAVVKFACCVGRVARPASILVRPMFVAPSLARVVAATPEWQRAWDEVESGFKAQLKVMELDDPLVWAGLRGDREHMRAVFESMGMLNLEDDANEEDGHGHALAGGGAGRRQRLGRPDGTCAGSRVSGRL